MRLRAVCAIFFAAALVVAGCRQPDGPLPAQTADDANRFSDISRDLINLSGGDANAPREFADDLKVWGSKSDAPWPPGDELAKRLGTALRGKTLSEQTAGQLTRQLWLAAAGRQLSSRQVDRLQEETRTLLVSLGVTEDAAESVSDQLGEMQNAVSTKRRWWFQLF